MEHRAEKIGELGELAKEVLRNVASEASEVDEDSGTSSMRATDLPDGINNLFR